MKLIDKDALVAEIKRKLHFDESWLEGDERWQERTGCKSSAYYKRLGSKQTEEAFLDYVNALEVKEVDLEKEIQRQYNVHKNSNNIAKNCVIMTKGGFEYFAKHFFELGLNASNPLTWEDMKLIWNITDEMDNMPEEEFYKEVLKRFKAQKVDIVMDE